LLYENGPWTVPNTDSPPIANPYSWNKIATVIWIDQPAYTGYSYSRTPYVTDEEGVAEEMRVFFIKFFCDVSPIQHPSILHFGRIIRWTLCSNNGLYDIE